MGEFNLKEIYLAFKHLMAEEHTSECEAKEDMDCTCPDWQKAANGLRRLEEY